MKNFLNSAFFAASMLTALFMGSHTLYAQSVVVGYKQKGKASFYANKFHNRKTASGETYSMFGMTAAHPTIPFNSIIKVTNLKNGRWVTLRINDRGPFSRSRVLDVSKAAAIKLDFVKEGNAQIELEVIRLGEVNPPATATAQKATEATPPDAAPAKTEATTTTTAPAPKTSTASPETATRLSIDPQQALSIARTLLKTAPNTVAKRFAPVNTYTIDGRARKPQGFGVQIGTFSDVLKAVEIVAEGYSLGMKELYIQSGWQNGIPAYRVMFGAEKTEAKAKELVKYALGKGFSDAFVRKHF